MGEDTDSRGYKFLKDDELNAKLLKGLEDLQDLYDMPVDQLIIIARRFNWNQ